MWKFLWMQHKYSAAWTPHQSQELCECRRQSGMNWDWAGNPALSSRNENEKTHTPSERFITCPVFECGWVWAGFASRRSLRWVESKDNQQETLTAGQNEDFCGAGAVRSGSWALRSSHSWVELTIKFKKINVHIFYRLLSFLSSTAAMCPSAFFFPLLNLLFPQITQSEQSCQIRENCFHQIISSLKNPILTFTLWKAFLRTISQPLKKRYFHLFFFSPHHLNTEILMHF